MNDNSQDIIINDYKFQVIIDSDEPENRDLKINYWRYYDYGMIINDEE